MCVLLCVPALQLLYYLAGNLLWVPNAVLILMLVFALGSPIADKAWACTDPLDSTCSSLLQNPDTAAVQSGFCTMDPSQWYWTDPGQKVVSRFNLVCKDAWKAQVANSFFFVGYFIGSGLFGVLSDIYGRKISTFGASALAAVFTAACIGATNYWALLSLRLLTGGQTLGQLNRQVQHKASILPRCTGYTASSRTSLLLGICTVHM
jgi:MFS family permease